MPGVSLSVGAERMRAVAAAIRRPATLLRLHKRLNLLLVADAKRNFDEGHGPNGEVWPPLKRPRKKGRSGEKPLRDTGVLMASLSAGRPGSISEVTPQGLRFGTSVAYASFHQRGTRTIPRRRFLGVGVELRRKMDAVVSEALAEVVRQIAGGSGGVA